MSNIFRTGVDQSNYTWDDLIQQLIARKLDTSAGKLDYAPANKCVAIADSTDISDDAHKIHFAYQIEHRFKLDGEAHPHLHWLQSSSDIPNWWMRWRFAQNGETMGSWTEVALDTQLFAYSAGTILQITKPASAIIDFSTAVGGKLGVSDFIHIELTRDSDNSSTLFGGADPLSGDALAMGFDLHLQVDSTGSWEEYAK